MVSLERQIIAAKRELDLRRKVYPGLLKRGQMTPEEAQEEITAMAAIIKTLQERLQDGRDARQMALFGGEHESDRSISADSGL